MPFQYDPTPLDPQNIQIAAYDPTKGSNTEILLQNVTTAAATPTNVGVGYRNLSGNQDGPNTVGAYNPSTWTTISHAQKYNG